MNPQAFDDYLLWCLTDLVPLHVITLCPETVFIVVPQTFNVNLSSLDVIDSHTNTRVFYKYIIYFPKHF